MVGIDISDRSVKIIQLSPQGDLLSSCWHEVPDGLVERGVINNEEQLKNILLEALQKCRLEPGFTDPVVASIPETESFLRVIEIPPMDESEVSEAVQWEVAQHIPFGLENVYIDWQWVRAVKPSKSKRREVLVGAAEKKVVDPLLTILHSLNLDIAAFELESQAIVRALISPELKAKKGLLVVDLGGAATNVVIHDHGAIRFTASLQKGAQSLLTALSPEEVLTVTGPPKDMIAADMKEIGKKLKANLDSLVIEVHGIVEFYTGLDSEHKVIEILLTGGGSNLPGLDEAFLRHFDDVHIQRGNPWVNILPGTKSAKPPMSLQESVHYSTALGLALRHVVA